MPQHVLADLEAALSPDDLVISDRDRTTLLVSVGGFGVGPVERLVRSLLELHHPARAVVVCGRSAELKATLTRWPRDGRQMASELHVGYTTEMDEYMAAADLLVGKPGGLTTFEALARGLVMVIVNPIPGQAARNADHLLEEGVAIRCNNLPVLPDRSSGSCAIPPAWRRCWRMSAGWLPQAAHAIVAALQAAGS